MAPNTPDGIGVVIDHIAVPVRHAESSAQFLAEILSVPVSRDGPEDEFYCLRLDHGGQILFTELAHFEPIHFALRVSAEIFAKAIDQLRRRGIDFGNDPDGTANGQTSDPLGGHGRAYFHSPDGHLFEICV